MYDARTDACLVRLQSIQRVALVARGGRWRRGRVVATILAVGISTR